MILSHTHLLALGALASGCIAVLGMTTATTVSTSLAATNMSVTDTPNFTYDKLYGLMTNFWDHFLYPSDNTQAAAINSTIFAENIEGRIDVTRNFTGPELNTEYLFGLFSNLAANSGRLSLLGVPLSYEIQKFSGNGYMNAASTKVMFNISSLNLLVPVVIDTWTSWNSLGQMTQYDGIFKYWGWLQDYVLETAMPLIGAKNTTQAKATLTPVLAQQICQTASTYCNSTNTDAADLYTSSDACINFLSTEVRWGEAYEFGRNTLMCRMLHQNMVSFRPSVHCSHIGPTGGDMCTDTITYVSTVNQELYDISWIPNTTESIVANSPCAGTVTVSGNRTGSASATSMPASVTANAAAVPSLSFAAVAGGLAAFIL